MWPLCLLISASFLGAGPATRPVTTKPASSRPAISEEGRERLAELLRDKKELEYKLKRLRTGIVESGYWGPKGYEIREKTAHRPAGFVFNTKETKAKVISRATAEISAINAELLLIRKGEWKPPPPPTAAELTYQEKITTATDLDIQHLKTGQHGYIRCCGGEQPTIKVYQIIDKENMIATWGHENFYWIKGMSTTDLVDNKQIWLDGIFEVCCTRKTPNGLSTVFQLNLVAKPK